MRELFLHFTPYSEHQFHPEDSFQESAWSLERGVGKIPGKGGRADCFVGRQIPSDIRAAHHTLASFYVYRYIYIVILFINIIRHYLVGIIHTFLCIWYELSF
jgi:hypothetical protein